MILCIMCSKILPEYFKLLHDRQALNSRINSSLKNLA
jgi:hypothetical protein